MQSEQTCIPKTFQLIDQLTGKTQTFPISVPYIHSTRELNMNVAFNTITSMGINLNNCQLFYLDFTRKLYVHIGLYPFKQEIFLKYQLFLQGSIKIRYRKVVPYAKYSKSTPTSPQPVAKKQKKKKAKERTIKQAEQGVTKWRNLYQEIDQQGKRKYNAQTAALQVGLSRKTLDDYYYQIRLAQYYGFNFEFYKNDKMGVLRRFVKQCQLQEQMKQQIKQQDIGKYFNSSSSQSDEQGR